MTAISINPILPEAIPPNVACGSDHDEFHGRFFPAGHRQGHLVHSRVPNLNVGRKENAGAEHDHHEELGLLTHDQAEFHVHRPNNRMVHRGAQRHPVQIHSIRMQAAIVKSTIMKPENQGANLMC